jgi:predicted RNase H-like HicB family nuclease
MEFYTVILRQSAAYWVALCLENGIVGQGDTQDSAITKLKEAIESFQAACTPNLDVHSAPIPIKELHEFLTLETSEPTSEVYEFRAVYA